MDFAIWLKEIPVLNVANDWTYCHMHFLPTKLIKSFCLCPQNLTQLFFCKTLAFTNLSFMSLQHDISVLKYRLCLHKEKKVTVIMQLKNGMSILIQLKFF